MSHPESHLAHLPPDPNILFVITPATGQKIYQCIKNPPRRKQPTYGTGSAVDSVGFQSLPSPSLLLYGTRAGIGMDRLSLGGV
jgi:hypothetical protein